MKSNFTAEEKALLDEFVFNIKKNINEELVVVQVSDIERQLDYTYHHGEGASYALLKRALPFLHDMYELSEIEYKALAKEAEKGAKYEVWHWEYQEELPDMDDELIVYRGANYVILKTGIRIDYGTDYYQQLREEFHRTGVYDEGLR